MVLTRVGLDLHGLEAYVLDPHVLDPHVLDPHGLVAHGLEPATNILLSEPDAYTLGLYMIGHSALLLMPCATYRPYPFFSFLADRTIGRAFGTLYRLSVVVCDVSYCGKTVRPSKKTL